MSQAKYIAVSAQLEKSIVRGQYHDRLPSVPELARQYRVAVQTMSNALKPLVRRGLIVTNNQGSWVNRRPPRRPRTHVVGVFGTTCFETPELDPLFHELSEVIAADGDDAVFMHTVRENLMSNADFWRGNYVDGYIFLYSSFSREFARMLQNNGLPFVAANRLPESFRADSVDWNHRQWFDDAIGALVAEGCRRIGVFLSRSFNEADNWPLEMSDVAAIKRDYQLPVTTLDDYRPERPETQLECAFELLMKQPVFPDALIMAGNTMHLLVERLRSAGWIPGRDYLLVAAPYEYFPTVVTGLFGTVRYDYCRFARAIWERFQQLREDPGQEPREIAVDMRGCFQRLNGQ